LAGFFGLFDYSKPGKGVRKDEPKGTRFVYFWKLFGRKFWQLCGLNLLYLLFCIPIVTIGPANAGFTYVLRNLATEQPVFMFSDFWDAFKLNWKQSFVYSLLLAVVAVVVVVSVQFYNVNTDAHSWMIVPAALCIFIGLIIILMTFYVMLMIVTLDLSLKSILKNALILAIVCLKTNLLTLLFTGLIVIATVLFFPISMILVLFIVPSWVGFIVCYNSYPGIKKYAIDPFMEQLEAQQDVANQTDSLFEDSEPQRK
jgi:uncharacterized membrane protein YesL